MSGFNLAGDLIGALTGMARATRKQYHLTLGKLIEHLRTAPDELRVHLSDAAGKGPGKPHSYRGYYEDLAFSEGDPPTVAQFRATCINCLDATFEGYKGGEFQMDADTPLWISEYGDNSGRAVTGVTTNDHSVVLLVKQAED